MPAGLQQPLQGELFEGQPAAQDGQRDGLLETHRVGLHQEVGRGRGYLEAAKGEAIEGDYDVLIDMFDSCFPTDVNWTLTITVRGSAPVILTGTLGPADELVGPQLITTFSVGP